MANLRIDKVNVRDGYYINGMPLGESGVYPDIFYKSSDTSDNITIGVVNLFMTVTQEGNFQAGYDHSLITTGNPHSVTKSEVGLGNVPNIDATNNVGKNIQLGHISDQPETIYGQKTFDEDIIINSNINTFGTETKILDTFAHGTYSSVKYNYELTDGTNYRIGKIDILSDGSTPQIQDMNNLNIGTSTQVTFTTTIDGTDTELNAVSTSAGWSIKFKKNVMI